MNGISYPNSVSYSTSCDSAPPNNPIGNFDFQYTVASIVGAPQHIPSGEYVQETFWSDKTCTKPVALSYFTLGACIAENIMVELVHFSILFVLMIIMNNCHIMKVQIALATITVSRQLFPFVLLMKHFVP